MWPFFEQSRAKNSQPKPSERKRAKELEELLHNVGELSHLGENNVALKFWLPTPAEQALKELCEHEGNSLTTFLRKTLAIHCYGVYALHVLNERHRNIFSEARFSVAETGTPYEPKKDPTYWVPELGKNIVPVKVWISAKLKEDITVLAEHVKLKPSQYVREILISRLLGHGTLPRRPESFGIADQAAAERWIEDGTANWREVTKEEYCSAYVGREMNGGKVIGEK